MRRVIFHLLLLLAPTALFAAAVATVTPGDTDLYRGSSIVSSHLSRAECVAAAEALNVERRYTCVTRDRVDVSLIPDAPPPPPPPTPSATPLLIDRFEYDVPRAGTGARSLFVAQGWNHVKSTNSGDGGAWGYLYTQTEPALNSRVLVVESRAGDAPVPPGFAYGQTDFYLQKGVERGAVYLPPNVWFQFTTTATPDSRFAARDKFLYPCRVFYPCGQGQWSWLLMQGSRGFEDTAGNPSDRFLAMQGETADFRAAAEYPTNATKMFQNVDPTPMVAGTWYDVRIHVDVSGEQGVYEAWRRVHGQMTWQPVSRWVGGVTPNFVWPLPASQRAGFELLRMPTTSNGPGNSTFKLDDFVIGRSVSELPQ